MTAPVAVVLGIVGLLFAIGTAEVVDEPATRERGGAPSAVPSFDPSEDPAAAFLDGYVDDDGRVVRHDQGGDTVSEGQAYAMLVAVAADDRARFDLVWRWTVEHLQRDDGLLAWHWADGEVVDEEPAADADLDAAHALVLAAARWGDDGYRWQAAELAGAVLEHETVVRGDRRLLVAGPWATGDPAVLNPSYASPLAATALAPLDARWREVLDGGRSAIEQVADASTALVPDWATERDGVAAAAPPPRTTERPRFGYDAARTSVRHALACEPADRSVAAAMWPFFRRVVDGGNVVAVYELDGAPATGDRHPLMLVAAAGAAAAAGEGDRVAGLLDAAERVQAKHPTYYGAAWLALGTALLDPASPLTACGATAG